MKTLKVKSLIIAASVFIVSGLTANNVFAQRSGHSGGGRGGSSYHGSSGHSSFSGRSSGGRSSFGSSRTSHIGSTRIYTRGRITHIGGRPGIYRGSRYRGGYHRPYYGYHHFYRPYLGFSLNILPFGYYPFYYGADQFYYSGGLFYRQYDDEYKVVEPPVGAEVPKLPSDAQEISINGQTYYEDKGIYYSAVEKDGKTVYVVAGKDGVLNTDDKGGNSAYSGPLIGDVVTELPQGAREVLLKGQKYYVSEDGVYYEEVVNGDKVSYKVVGL